MSDQPVKPPDPEVDFVNLAKTIWQRKMLVVKLTGMAAIAGFLISMLIPNRYTASTMLVQEISDPSITLNEAKLSAMSALAAIAGVDLSGLSKAKMSPRTFSDIISSIPFRKELMQTKLNFSQTDSATTLYNYYTKTGSSRFQVNSTISQPQRLTDPVKEGENIQNNPRVLPKLTVEEIQLNKILDKQVSIQVKEDEYINISCTLPEAIPAAQLTRKAGDLLQHYLIEIQTEKSRANLQFIQGRYDEAKRNFLKIGEVQAPARETYQTTAHTAYQATLQTPARATNQATIQAPAHTANQATLSSDYRLAEKLYFDLAEKLEQAKIALNEQTPVFKIVNPITVPTEKSSPNNLKITIISAFFGFVLAMALVLGKDFIDETKERWRRNG